MTREYLKREKEEAPKDALKEHPWLKWFLIACLFLTVWIVGLLIWAYG